MNLVLLSIFHVQSTFYFELTCLLILSQNKSVMGFVVGEEESIISGFTDVMWEFC